MSTSLLDRAFSRLSRATLERPTGTVTDVVGLVVEVGGLRAGVGDVLHVRSEGPSELELEVIGFRRGRLLATPLGSIAGIRPGVPVVRDGRGSSIGVSSEMLGRIVDAFGRPMDGRETPQIEARRPIHCAPPPAVSRRPITRAFHTHVRAIDALLTIGEGQRMGIFAGAGVGKSTLLGMICRRAEADVNVVALVGERGRELGEFVSSTLGEEGLAKSVVIVATSDQPPLVRARAAETATAVAEHFRDQGKRVLLVMDSVTRYAMALREAALASGEPPATKGYPPSVFAALPRLLERAGTGPSEGSITALYTVLVEGDEMTDPVADAVRSILDGHVVLSRKLADRGHFPAIDVLASVSRLAMHLMSGAQAKDASTVRESMATYASAADLVHIGAYVPGSDPRVDSAVRSAPAIDAFLRQDVEDGSDPETSRAHLEALARSTEGA